MAVSAGRRQELIESAQAVLDGNRAGDSTKPSPDLYPHQWMWDSCFIAIGLSRYDPARAQGELRALLRGQWSNGMVPQIIFNPDSTGYFPGPDVWQSERSPLAPRGVETSGITQPPVLATAALFAFERDPDRDRALAFGREVYPKIKAFHEFLYRERNPDASGLITVVHPWESGLDNSPPYLDAGSRVHLTYKPEYTRLDTQHVSAANRPSNKDYDLFVWLLEQMRDANYDWGAYLQMASLQVEDVLFNCLLCQANDDLHVLSEALGVGDGIETEPGKSISPFEKHRTWEAIQEQLWDGDAGLFFSRDRLTGKLLADGSVVSLAPLTRVDRGQRLARARESALRAAIRSKDVFGGARYTCPSTALNSPRFNPENYWLGPVWVNTNWLLLRGGTTEPKLFDDTIDLVDKSGFREYFNPDTGEGYGTNRFSWSAALTIDLLWPEGGRALSPEPHTA